MDTVNPSLPTTSGVIHRGTLYFMASLVVMGTVWLVLLPAVSRIPSIAEERARQRAQGIDPSAMYYTELEMIERTGDWLREIQGP